MGANPQEPAKPLSLFEKIKAGATGFAKSVVSYLPRGLIFAGIILGGSALLETAFPGVGFLNVTGMVAKGGIGALASRVGMTLLIGGTISGGMGAWQSIKGATEARESLRAEQAGILARHRSQGLGQHIAYDAPLVPQPDLPMGTSLGKQQTPHI